MCVRACVRACVRVCERAFVCACVCVEGVIRVSAKELYMGMVVLDIVTFVIRKHCHLVVDIRLIALIAMPVLGYVSTEFERERNVISRSLYYCGIYIFFCPLSSATNLVNVCAVLAVSIKGLS